MIKKDISESLFIYLKGNTTELRNVHVSVIKECAKFQK